MVNKDNFENRFKKLENRVRKTSQNQKKYRMTVIQGWGLAGWKAEGQGSSSHKDARESPSETANHRVWVG